MVDTAGWPPFGQFVGARRQELRLTRGALAEALGVSPGTVVAWELGYRVPGSTQLPRLAAALSVDTGSLAAALPRRVRRHHPRRADPGSPARARACASADLAQLTGTTEATVSRWVNGRSRPGPRTSSGSPTALAAALWRTSREAVAA